MTVWRTRRILYFKKRGQLHRNLSSYVSRQFAPSLALQRRSGRLFGGRNHLLLFSSFFLSSFFYYFASLSPLLSRQSLRFFCFPAQFFSSYSVRARYLFIHSRRRSLSQFVNGAFFPFFFLVPLFAIVKTTGMLKIEFPFRTGNALFGRLFCENPYA